jgi:anti-sigma factor RsiW
MTEEQQLKLQSFLDGELPEHEAREMISLIARDEEAKALHAELKNTRTALKGSKMNVQLPESREFFWSKIEREIQRLEPVSEPKPSVSLFDYLRRLLMPMSAAAVILVAGFIAFRPAVPGRSTDEEMAVADSGAFTYHDYSAGMTLVWLPFPAENELAQNGPATTIQ